jgi:hypothetical protein
MPVDNYLKTLVFRVFPGFELGKRNYEFTARLVIHRFIHKCVYNFHRCSFTINIGQQQVIHIFHSG